jgi:hypothetical protein
MLIGINGFKGAGKDTVGDILVKHYGFTKLSFAAKLKQSVAALFDIPLEDVDRYKNLDASVVVMGKSMSFRVFLQRYGTESHREVFGDTFWVEQLLPIPHWSKKYVITDARFENELRAVREYDGYNVQVVRPGIEGDGHASEVAPHAKLIDYVITNEEPLETGSLEMQISDVLDRMGEST